MQEVFCFKDNYYKKFNLVNNIFNEIENNNLKFVYIYFFNRFYKMDILQMLCCII